MDASNVLVAVTGAIYRADAADTPTLPVDPLTPLDSAFDELGYADESGIVETQGQQTNEIKAWQNAAVVRKVLTQHDLTYAFTLLESSEEALEAFYGNYSGTEGDAIIEIRGELGVRGPWVLHVVDGDTLLRVVIPDGEVTDRGAVNYVSGDAIKYPITVTAYPDTDGVKAYIYRTNAAIESA
jgi:hypothetical protein